MLGWPHPVRHKSQNATDFGDAPIASMIGNGWTVRTTLTSNLSAAVVASSNSLSGRRAEISKLTSDGYRMISWDRISSVASVEILVLMHIMVDPPGTDETTGQITVRASASNADPYYVCLPCEVASVKKFEIGKGDGAGGGSRLGNVNKSWNTSNLWWVRFRCAGNSQRGKMWQYQTPEPTSWENDFADTDVPGAGFTGFGLFFAGNDYAILWLSVATGGDTAPAPGG